MSNDSNTTQRDELARDIFIADNHRDPNAAEEWDAFSDIGGACGGDYAYSMAESLIAKGYRKPRTITTVEELDALVMGAVIRDVDEEPMEKADDGWRYWVYDKAFPSRSLNLPATVLWDPEAEANR